MYALSEALRYEMIILLISFIVIITYQLLTNKINTKGFMLDKTGGRAFSPGRLQMLVVTLSIALYYLLMLFGSKEPGRFPDLPDEFLLVLGGSHAFYLSGKLYGLLASRLGFASPLLRERAQHITERRMKK